MVKAKDDVFAVYLVKKRLLQTVVDIFIANPNRHNVLHSCVLELFDYLTTKDQNKKIAAHLLELYSDVLFKAPQFQAYFRNFVTEYEERLSKQPAGRPFKPDPYGKQQRELLKRQDEDLLKFGERSAAFKSADDEDKLN